MKLTKILLPTFAISMFTASMAFAADLAPTTDSAPANTHLTSTPTTVAQPKCFGLVDSECLKSAFAKVVFRKEGQWSEKTATEVPLDKLSQRSRETMEMYPDFAIISISVDRHYRFNAKVAFSYAAQVQVNYVVGTITPGPKGAIAVWAASVEANMSQRAYREAVRDKETVYRPSLNNQIPAGRVRMEDALRNLAVMDAINVWLSGAGETVSAVASSEETY